LEIFCAEVYKQAAKERQEDISSAFTCKPKLRLHEKLESPATMTPVLKGEKKGRAIPLQAWTVPESSKRLRFPDFETIGT
jgi:hypothetical protein